MNFLLLQRCYYSTKLYHIVGLVTFFFAVSFSVFAADVPISAAQIKQANIKVAKLQASQVSTRSITLQGQAQLAPNQKVMVSSPVAGVIERIDQPAMAQLKQQSPILTIYSPDVINLQNDVLQLRSQLSLALQTLKRERRLFNEGIIAKKRVYEAENAVQQLNIQIAAKTRLLKFNGANTGTLNAKVVVRSPHNGLLEQLSVSTGQHVDVGQNLAQVSNLDAPLTLILHANRQSVAQIQVGDLVNVTQCNISGRVQQVGTTLNDVSQTIDVLVQMQSAANCLKANQFVTATVVNERMVSPQQRPTMTWHVPKSAVAFSAGQSIVFVRTAKGFKPVNVKKIAQNGNMLTVQSVHLNAAQYIALNGVMRLKAIMMGYGAEQEPQNKNKSSNKSEDQS